MGRIGYPDHSGGSGLGLCEDSPLPSADGEKRLCARQHGTSQLGLAVVSDCQRDHQLAPISRPREAVVVAGRRPSLREGRCREGRDSQAR